VMQSRSLQTTSLKALGLGADQAEAYVRSSRSLSVEVKDQVCDSLSRLAPSAMAFG